MSGKELDELRALLSSGAFHHATYRNEGTLWEGLWVYRRDPDGFGGYSVALCVLKDSVNLNEAIELCRGTGISHGSYGKG